MLFFYEKERGVQVSKQKLEIREAMTLLLLYYVSPPTKLRVGFVNNLLRTAAEFRALSPGEIWRLQKKDVFLPPLTGQSGKLTI